MGGARSACSHHRECLYHQGRLGTGDAVCKELTDASLPETEEDEILKIANEEEGVGEIHNLRTRRIGNKIAIEMHVRMPGSLSLYEAHEHATHIEIKLKQHFGADTHVGIHLEPIKVNGKYQKPE